MKKYQFKYRFKGDTVEAVQLTKENVDEVANWCSGQQVTEHNALNHDEVFVALNLMTGSGAARAGETNYIVMDNMGVFHVIEKHLFDNTFETYNE